MDVQLIQVRVPSELAERVRALAAVGSLNVWIVEALRERVERET